MAMLYVRALPGRRIPYEGKTIPTDQFIPVADIPYIRGLFRWPDIEAQGDKPRTTPAPSPQLTQRPATAPSSAPPQPQS